MFTPKSGTKQEPVRRWRLSERAFFGHGACHILAHEFLKRFPKSGFNAVWIKPLEGFSGNHVFVTNGAIAFDYRGYLAESRLTSYYWEQYVQKISGWNADLVIIQGNLSDPVEMMEIGMHIRGPDQFLYNATPRARAYLRIYDELHKRHA